MFRVENIAGYFVLLAYGVACWRAAPPEGDLIVGLGYGLLYFLFVWLLMGFYLGNVVHLGLAHRAIDFPRWFVFAITLLANSVGIYLNPTTWTNRHRLHHRYSDRPGDPNKLAGDGFLKTCYLMLFPYPAAANVATDEIFETWPMRLVSNRGFAVLSQLTSFFFVWLWVRDWTFALVLWLGVRCIAAYVHVIQNYWTHEKRFGSRRYEDDDHAVNVTNVLPVTLSFSACLQNNHHHNPRFARLSHDDNEYDWGFLTIRWMHKLGLATPTPAGREVPPDAPLTTLGLGQYRGPKVLPQLLIGIPREQERTLSGARDVNVRRRFHLFASHAAGAARAACAAPERRQKH